MLADPNTYQQTDSQHLIAEFNQKLQILESDLEALMMRWDELESR